MPKEDSEGEFVHLWSVLSSLKECRLIPCEWPRVSSHVEERIYFSTSVLLPWDNDEWHEYQLNEHELINMSMKKELVALNQLH